MGRKPTALKRGIGRFPRTLQSACRRATSWALPVIKNGRNNITLSYFSTHGVIIRAHQFLQTRGVPVKLTVSNKGRQTWALARWNRTGFI